MIDHNKRYGLAVLQVGALAFVGANNAALVDEYFLARFAHNKAIALSAVEPFHRAILAWSTGLWGFAFVGGVWLGGTVGILLPLLFELLRPRFSSLLRRPLLAWLLRELRLSSRPIALAFWARIRSRYEH